MQTGRLVLFALAGALAFLVDAGILQLLVWGAGMDPYLARIGSFLCAVTTTWVFNRSVTFVDVMPTSGPWGQWCRYVISQLGGFSVNYFVYAVLVGSLAVVRQWPALGVGAGSLAGLIVNYFFASRFVFRRG